MKGSIEAIPIMSIKAIKKIIINNTIACLRSEGLSRNESFFK